MRRFSGPQREAVEAHEGTMGGHAASELWPGDTVLIKKDPTVDRVGALRFQPRVYPGVYRIKRKVDRHTFYVEDVADPNARLGFLLPLNASRLVRLDMPELALSEAQPRRLETRRRDGEDWMTCTVERFAADGRVSLREETEGSTAFWVDLSECEYRWLC